MPSLREIAMRTSPGQRALGTEGGTSLEQVEQARSLFHLVREHDSGLEQGFSQKSANDWPCSSVPFPRARNNGTSLPDDLVAGVARLKKMRTPRLRTPDAWPIAVNDASYLAESGWAAKALAMTPTWSVIDLFGATGDPEGDPYEIGLAVWLNGRRLLAMDEKCAVVPDAGGWSYYHRRELRGAVPLWDLGR